MPYTLAKARGGVVATFPLKLHYILSQEEISDIISWQPHGRSFKLHDPEKFLEKVMPLHFEQTKLSSFRRQLNLYGFRRFLSGRDKGGYYHEMFLRGQPELCSQMIRTTVKGTSRVKVAEPNFYKMPFSHQDQLSGPQPIHFRSVSPSSSDDDLDFVSSSHTGSHSGFEEQRCKTLHIPSNQSAFVRTCDGNSFNRLPMQLEENTGFGKEIFDSFENRHNQRLSSFGVTEFEGKEFQSLDHTTYNTLKSHFSRRFSNL
jgi:hypothetical protein